jgi:hypothetical protein
MKKTALSVAWLMAGLCLPALAGNPQRMGQSNFTPRHTSPDDKGLYAAAIDPANGYAYFIGNYLWKLDITGNLPVPVGPAIFAGQPAFCAIDPAAGQLYASKSVLTRFALNGTNAVTSNGSLSLAAGYASEILVDDSDPNPTNHYGYVLCTTTGGPASVEKVALGTFTELGSIPLAANESNFIFAAVADARNGYGYYVTSPGVGSDPPVVVKIKFTPGTNAPVRVGALSFGVSGDFVDGGSIDTVHGYAYYGTYGSSNLPARVYKVRLETGDVPPTLVGEVDLHAGEARLAASVCDPTNGFVYFADDNTYPGHLYQFALNGTNPPLEIASYAMQSTTNIPPPNGTTTNNTTTNLDGVLPFGEVFFRSAVIDPLHGFAYLGQDSRPNQVVKVQLAKVDAINVTSIQPQANIFQFGFSNILGGTFSVYATTNLTQPLANWTPLGAATESPPGQFQFADPQITNLPQRFYRVTSP